ncbi:MAG TPA: zf-HC2 domain-containing protein [Polyangiaceae bacterium]
MDCETFDKLVIDRVFGELDDLTSGAVQRHVAHCSRCRNIESGLRATREITALSAPDLPPGFIENLVILERSTRTRLPLQQRVGRTVSVLSGYAMRPQLTMGALLLLMIGSSLFLLRTRPGDRELVQITERGVPEGEVESLPQTIQIPSAVAEALPSSASKDLPSVKSEAGPAATPAAASSQSGWLATARDAFQNGNFSEAHELAERAIAVGGTETGQAALLSAEALARDAGCSAALARFEALRTRHGRTSVGDEAAWQAAECHRSLGRFDRAKQLYEELKFSAAWGKSAKERLRGESFIVSPAASPPAASDSPTSAAP